MSTSGRRRGWTAFRLLASLGGVGLLAWSGSTILRRPGEGSGDGPGYPPLDIPKPVADGVFVVDSTLPGPLGSVLPVRMTAIRLPDGTLLLHSPTRHNDALRQALEAIGPIRTLVAPNVAHWTFLQEWQRAVPQAVTWAAPGLRQRRQVRESAVRLDRDLGDVAPDSWGDAIGLLVVPGGFGFHDVALFHRPSRTLLLTDLVLNLEAEKLPPPMRPVARLLGVTAPDGMPPPYLRAVIGLRHRAASAAARAMLALRPERVVFAHGRWFEQDGTAALARSLRWLVRPRPAEHGSGPIGPGGADGAG